MAQTHVSISAEIRASDVTVQIRDYLWPTPNEADVQIEAEPTFALRVSPRPEFAEGRHKINPHSGRFSTLGDLIFHPPAMPIHVRGSGGRMKVVTCSVSRQRFETLTGIADGCWDSPRLQACLDIRSAPIDGTLLRLAREAVRPGFASGILIESLGVGLLVELSRFFDEAAGGSGIATGRLAPWQLHQLTEYLEAVSGHSPTLAELARQCGISPDHLGRAFKRTTGQPIMRYAEQVRIRKAKTLLSQTDLSMKEISYRLGFPSQSGFSIAFRRRAGETPGKFRQQFRRSVGDDT
ncbi:MAG TPA: AraC family transcriptional regulator [Alphaproteobacteria bacterium]|nr:AraC family transcriptional regulator [Alphaproteobacteria bacterium]